MNSGLFWHQIELKFFRFSHLRSKNSVRREINLAFILIGIVSVFIICNIPRVCLNFYEVFLADLFIRYPCTKMAHFLSVNTSVVVQIFSPLLGFFASPASTNFHLSSTPQSTSPSTCPWVRSSKVSS